jgi:glutathione S-transferase
MAGIILHHYPRSPFAEKVRLALGLKGLDYHSVSIPALMPKPELMPLTGGYRRTPVMQVGADIYCDTLEILRQIDRMHLKPSLYPGATEGVATALGCWIEKATFVPAVGVVRALSDAPSNPAMSRDRREFFGFDIDKPAMLAQLPIFLQRLTVHMSWLGQMMGDGRDFLLGATPGAADLSAFHPIWFIRQNSGPGVDALLPGLAALQGWFERVAAIGHGRPQEMAAAEALIIAAKSEPAALDPAASVVAGCRLGQQVSVMPDDTGRDPVRGTLLAASDDTVVLGRTDPTVGRVNLHFPRAGFDVIL